MDGRYTDSDVRADASLRTLAESYLRTYAGTFDFLLETKRLVDLNWPINTPTIRGVLNCMLADPTVVNMPVPAKQVFDAGEQREQEAIKPPPTTYGRKVPYRVPLKVKWNYRYGISNHVQAKAIHALDVKRSNVAWYPQSTFNDGEREYVWQVYWKCASYMSYTNPFGKIVLLDDEQVSIALKFNSIKLDRGQVPDEASIKWVGFREWKLCKTCVRLTGQLSRSE